MKQAIHPAQVEIIHRAFAPSEKGEMIRKVWLIADIEKAARIKQTFEEHGEKGQGAYALDGAMIDAPVYKQVSLRGNGSLWSDS